MMTRMPRAALALAGTILLTACSTAASPTPTETAGDAPTLPSAASGSPSADASATPDPAAIDPWRANASQHRGMDGQQFEYDCPAAGVADTIWGTDTYTDDSSVCTAAVHVGAISLEDGGTVTIEMRAGEDEYEGTVRNGIESSSYPAWGGSFVIIDD